MVLIGFNSMAGARDAKEAVEKLQAALARRDLAVEIFTDRDALAQRADSEHRAGTLCALVAAGGDGTASDLVNRTMPGVPIALLPLGTENLVARYFGLTSDPVQLADTIAARNTVRLDAGRANGRLFLLMAGCGFDAEVVHRLHAGRRGHISQWSYAKPIAAAIRSYRYPEFRITYRLNAPESETSIEHMLVARWAFIANLPSYAGRLCFSPRATADDGRLDICAFHGSSCWSGMRYLIGVLSGRHEAMRDCVTARATQITIEADEPVPYQLDGDPGGMLPLAIDVLPRRMTLVVPADYPPRGMPDGDAQGAIEAQETS
jgi:diacylglycerol kinase family enzyme